MGHSEFRAVGDVVQVGVEARAVVGPLQVHRGVVGADALTAQGLEADARTIVAGVILRPGAAVAADTIGQGQKAGRIAAQRAVLIDDVRRQVGVGGQAPAEGRADVAHILLQVASDRVTEIDPGVDVVAEGVRVAARQFEREGIDRQDRAHRTELFGAILERQVDRVGLAAGALDDPLIGQGAGEARAIDIQVRDRELGAENADVRAQDRLGPDHLRNRVGLEVGAHGDIVVQPAAIEARHDPVVRVIGTIGLKLRLHAGVEAEFRQARGQLALVEEDVEAQDLGPTRIVDDGQANVIGPLGEGEVAEIIVAGLQLQAAHGLAVDIDLDHRGTRQGEAARTTRARDQLRLQRAVAALEGHARHARSRLIAARHRLQVARRPTDHVLQIIKNQARALALELGDPARRPDALGFQHHAVQTRGEVQIDDGIAQTLVRALMNIVQVGACVQVGREPGRLRIIPQTHPVQRRDRHALGRTELRRNLEHQLQGLGVVGGEHAHARQVLGRDRRLARQVGANGLDRRRGHDVRQQIQRPHRSEADAVIGVNRQDDIAQIQSPVLGRNRQGDGAPRRIQALLTRSGQRRIADRDGPLLRKRRLPRLRRRGMRNSHQGGGPRQQPGTELHGLTGGFQA
ncbi:hypothetical protein D3C87_947550 [compost metagenome]